MFTNSKPFGSTSAFGTSSFGTTSSPFGQSNTAFGAKPAGNNVFGSSTFGTSTPSTGGLFGTTTPSTGTSLFGQPSTAFGQPASTSGGSFGFGSTSTTGGLFGTNTQPTQSSSLFGNTATSAFGTPRPTFGGFGTSTTGTGLFGQSTSTGTGLFGASTGFSSAPNGTTIKFNPPTGTDTMMKGGVSTNISTRHQCITCMKEYENKSLEELRVEDYAANRKGPQTGMSGFGTTGQTGLFGQPAASTSAFSFGNTTQSKPLFGTTGTSTFGTGTNLFGQTSQPQSTSMFNKPVGFGAATTSAGGAFGFGGMSNTSTFGQNSFQKPFGQTGTGTGLFGTTTTTQPSTAFGTGTAFGGFGSTTPQSTGLFGVKPTGFGSTNTTTTSTFTFGTASNVSGGGLFGNKPNVSAFGTNTSSFGTPSSGMGVFGTTQTGNTGLFGANKPATGFGTGFGSGLGTSFGTSLFSSNLPTNTGPGLFGGSTANKGLGFSFTGMGNTGNTTGGFGQSGVGNPSLGFGASTGFGIGSDPNASALMQQQYQAQQQILALAANPFGDSPLFRNSIKETNKREELLKPTNPAAQKAVLSNNQYKVSPLPSAKIKPKPIPLIPNGKVSLFDGLDDEDTNLANMTFVPKKSVKKLVIKPKLSPHTTSLTVTSNISTTSKSNEIILSTSVHVGKPDSRDGTLPPVTSAVVTPNANPIASNEEPSDNALPLERIDSQSSDSHKNIKKLSENVIVRNSLNSSLDDTFAALHTRSSKHQGRALGISLESETSTPCKEKSSDHPVTPFHEHCQGDVPSNPIGVVLTRPGYYTIPSVDEMVKMMDSDGNCNVENFTVGHEKYGKVCFPGITNVAGLNLDEIVHFRPKEITVYPDDDDKPPVGEGLNRKAEVTLDCVWPTDKTTHTPIKDPERLALIGYQEKIEKATKKLNATFIDYRPETGSWVFQVLHFSKYGLEESDEEYDEVQQVPDTNGKIVVPLSKAQQVMPTLNGHSSIEADLLKRSQMKKQLRLADHDDEMEDLSSQALLKESEITEDEGLSTDFHVSTHRLASALGVQAERIQGMKASFFQDDMDDNWGVPAETTRKDSSGISQMKILRTAEQHTPQSPATPSRFQLSKRNSSLLMKESVEIATTPVTPVIPVAQQKEVARNEAYTAARNEILSSYPLVQPLTLPQEGVPMETSVSGASRKLALKPFARSLTYGKQKKLADMGYFMGRRFRAGWGPNWTLSYLGESHTDQSTSATKSATIFTLLSRPATIVAQQFSPLNVSVGRLQLLSDSSFPVDAFIKKNLQESLEIQLENAAVATEDGAPTFVAKCGVKSLHDQAELSHKHLDQTDALHLDHDIIKQCCNVWELCVCLWGSIPGMDQEQEISGYAQQMARREALTKWLIKTGKDTVLSEINNSKDRKDYLNALFCHLTGKQISEACHLAQGSYDHRLALLLSQAGVNYIVKKLINKQLMNWEQNKADKFVSKGRLKLYALLAGTLVWHASESVVNCCEGLDWKRSLALHLWYQCHPSSSVQDAVAQYENAFQGSGDQGRYAQPPYPPYIEKSDLLSDLLMTSDETMEESEPLYDTCFYLLKLYCDRSQRLDKLLMPGASTPSPLDHRLSWLLYQSLSALGYDHLSTDAASALHCNFASQLETMDMWHWAAFVLLHIPDSQRRTKCVKELLLRHLSLSQSEENREREAFLYKKLKIPEEWIFEAKAIKAHFLGQPAEEAWFLLKAGLWSKSHTIIITHLASDAIINENYDYLLSYLKELSPPERSSTILDWSIGGQVFLDYIHISQTVENVIKGEVSAYDLEKLQPEVVSLCHRLSSIRCFSAKDRLCQAEMAKKTATLLRAVYTLQQARTGNKASLYILAPHINNLPMPEDYTLQEIRAMARGYMQAVASE